MILSTAFIVAVDILITVPLLWIMRRDFIDATRQVIAVRNQVKGRALKHWSWLLCNQP
jgi:hypothetical protein